MRVTAAATSDRSEARFSVFASADRNRATAACQSTAALSACSRRSAAAIDSPAGNSTSVPRTAPRHHRSANARFAAPSPRRAAEHRPRADAVGQPGGGGEVVDRRGRLPPPRPDGRQAVRGQRARLRRRQHDLEPGQRRVRRRDPVRRPGAQFPERRRRTRQVGDPAGSLGDDRRDQVAVHLGHPGAGRRVHREHAPVGLRDRLVDRELLAADQSAVRRPPAGRDAARVGIRPAPPAAPTARPPGRPRGASPFTPEGRARAGGSSDSKTTSNGSVRRDTPTEPRSAAPPMSAESPDPPISPDPPRCSGTVGNGAVGAPRFPVGPWRPASSSRPVASRNPVPWYPATRSASIHSPPPMTAAQRLKTAELTLRRVARQTSRVTKFRTCGSSKTRSRHRQPQSPRRQRPRARAGRYWSAGTFQALRSQYWPESSRSRMW